MGRPGRRRALLIGCNYPGTKAELRGCANDVQAEKQMLMDVFNFTEKEIQIMLDSDPTTERPTGINLRRRFSQLARWAQAGDIIYIHYSGHGVQIPCLYDHEDDNLDEAIVPSDMNVIIDDDLRFIFSHMDPGAKLTFVIDCCHSGSMLDHPKQCIQTSRNKAEDMRRYQEQLYKTRKYFQSSLSCIDKFGTLQMNRGLTLEAFADLLGTQTNQNVHVDNVHYALKKGFGKHASMKIKDSIQPRLWWFLTKWQSTTDSRKATTDGALNIRNDHGVMRFFARQKSDKQQLKIQQGILFAGCQDFETSADVAPEGNKHKAYGALTHCLTTIIRNHYLSSPIPDQVIPLTNKQVVLKIRAMLSKMGFKQNPSLECSDEDANATFLQ